MEQQTPDGPQRYRLQFTGDAKEYFRIWVVNLALMVVTLGIYSAWAKVRKQRYFYSNTLLDGSSFGYNAQPLAILRGRLVAVALLATYWIASRTSLIATVIIVLGVVFAMPWLVVKSRIFSMRVTSWRGLQFGFRPDYAGAYLTLILWPLLGILTLGILWPRFTRERYIYFVSRTRYGTSYFDTNPQVGRFYRTAFGAAGLGIGIGFIIGMVSYIASNAVDLRNLSYEQGEALKAIPAILNYVLLIPAVLAYVYARNVSEVLSTTTLGQHQFTAQFSAGKLAGIYITNILAIAFSLGMLIPWAQIRLARYRVEAVQLDAYGSLDAFVAAHDTGKTGAVGEEISSFFDLDFGF